MKSTSTAGFVVLCLVAALSIGLGLAAEYTVCPGGTCDFLSPNACSQSVITADTCTVYSGTYHEMVEFAPCCPLASDVTFRCAPGNTCVIDGDNVRDHGFYGYSGWVIEGFEIRNTLGDALTTTPSRPYAAVRDCYIHDVKGRAITSIDGVVERNTVKRVGGYGVLCNLSDAIVRNNLFLDTGILAAGAAIQCSASGDLVSHNTVDVRNRTAPYFGPVAYGINGDDVRYNLVAGGNTSLRAMTLSTGNMVLGGSAASWSGVAPGVDDTVADPLFQGPEDHYLQAGSPAIDTAFGSAESVDVTGSSRVGVPDRGAIEFDATHAAVDSEWSRREQFDSVADYSSVATIMIPGQGPAVAYLDEDRNALIYGWRKSDGSWMTEIVQEGLSLPFSLNLPDRIVDLAVDPASGKPIVGWVDLAGGAPVLRIARRAGNGCGADCSSLNWSGCSDPPALTGDPGDRFNIRLGIKPLDGRPSVAILHSVSGGCGSSDNRRVLWLSEVDGVGWVTQVLEVGDCALRPGRDVGMCMNSVSGDAEVLYTRYDTGVTTPGLLLRSAVRDGAAPVPEEVPLAPLDGAYSAFPYENAFITTGCTATGEVGIGVWAAQAGSPFGVLAYVQGNTGDWSAPEIVDSGRLTGLDLALDSSGQPAMAYAVDNVLSYAQRAEDWNTRFLDTRNTDPYWPDLESGADSMSVGLHVRRPGRDIEVWSAGDPGGQDPAYVEDDDCDADDDTITDPVDNCPLVYNPTQELIPFPHVLYASSSTMFAWSAPQDVHWVRGDLVGVTGYSVDLSQSFVGVAGVQDLAVPALGAGFYYLVRSSADCSSWQSSSASEPDRDLTLP